MSAGSGVGEGPGVDEIELVAGYLSGAPRQRRTGIELTHLTVLPPPADRRVRHPGRGRRRPAARRRPVRHRVVRRARHAVRRAAGPAHGRRAAVRHQPAARRAAPGGTGVGGADRGGRRRRRTRGRGTARGHGQRQPRPGRERRAARGAAGPGPLHPHPRPGGEPDAGRLGQDGARGAGPHRARRGGVEARRHPGPDPRGRRAGHGADPVAGRHHRPRARGGRGGGRFRADVSHPGRRADRAARRRTTQAVPADRVAHRQPHRPGGRAARGAADAVRLRRAAPRRARPAGRAGQRPPGGARGHPATRGAHPSAGGGRRGRPGQVERATAFAADAVARGHEGVVVKSDRRDLRHGPARRRLGQGQAGAHPRPGGPRRGARQRPAQRLAEQPAPGCAGSHGATASRAASSCWARRSRV